MALGMVSCEAMNFKPRVSGAYLDFIVSQREPASSRPATNGWKSRRSKGKTSLYSAAFRIASRTGAGANVRIRLVRDVRAVLPRLPGQGKNLAPVHHRPGP